MFVRVIEILSLLDTCTFQGMEVPCDAQVYLQSRGRVVWVRGNEVERGVCIKACILHTDSKPFALLDKGTRLEVVSLLSGCRLSVQPFELAISGANDEVGKEAREEPQEARRTEAKREVAD